MYIWLGSISYLFHRLFQGKDYHHTCLLHLGFPIECLHLLVMWTFLLPFPLKIWCFMLWHSVQLVLCPTHKVEPHAGSIRVMWFLDCFIPGLAPLTGLPPLPALCSFVSLINVFASLSVFCLLYGSPSCQAQYSHCSAALSGGLVPSKHGIPTMMSR